MKKIIVLIISTILISSFIFYNNIIKHDSNKDNKSNDIVEVKPIKQEEIKEKPIVKEEKEKVEQETKIDKQETKTKTETNNKEIKENKTNNSSTSRPVTNVEHKEEQKQEEKTVVVQKQPWEELGLTEDQYKNQPMYSWEEVDFKTKEECINYGNEHAEYGFECSEVTSWTRSLGWDYKTF